MLTLLSEFLCNKVRWQNARGWAPFGGAKSACPSLHGHSALASKRCFRASPGKLNSCSIAAQVLASKLQSNWSSRRICSFRHQNFFCAASSQTLLICAYRSRQGLKSPASASWGAAYVWDAERKVASGLIWPHLSHTYTGNNLPWYSGGCKADFLSFPKRCWGDVFLSPAYSHVILFSENPILIWGLHSLQQVHCLSSWIDWTRDCQPLTMRIYKVKRILLFWRGFTCKIEWTNKS